jgi:preprotein translocase subunit SecD
MDRKTRWKTFWLGLIVVVAAGILLPNFVPKQSLPRWFPDNQIQLGLDLRGGLHIVYSIALDKAVDDKATELQRDLEAKLAEYSIAGRVTTPRPPIGAVSIHLDDPADRARIDARFLSDYDEIVVRRECPAEQRENSVCLRVSSDYAQRTKEAALEQAIDTIRDRIDERGVAEPTVISKGDQIIVELPGLIADPDDPTAEDPTMRVREIIARAARLEFKIVDDDSQFMANLYAHVTDDPEAERLGIEGQVDLWRHDESGNQFRDYFLTAPDRVESFDPEEARRLGLAHCETRRDGREECRITGRQIIDQYLAALAEKDPAFAIGPDNEIGYEYVEPEGRDATEAVWRSYYLHRAVELSGTAVTDAYVYWNSTTNRPEVLVSFNRWGGRRFGELTSQNIGKKMTIILDERIRSAPVIQGAIHGGRSSITMGGGNPQVVQKDAEDLVSVLKTGALPAPLQEESLSQVGPLLGRDAIARAQISFALGALLVLLVMVYVYRFSGAIAMVALGLNVALMMAILSLFQATLTLPGIAAVVLTLGMAVDANIIIYERIREELRAGKSVRGAVDAGFSHAFSAILDAQLTTAVAGWVLLQYGSGPIRGFAVMLLIGIGTTLFTAMWASRLFFEYYVGRGRKVSTIGI